MYSLFVSTEIAEKTKRELEIARSRFLEYTSDSISVQLRALSTEAIECMKSWPCLLMQEGRGEEVAHVAQVSALQVDGNNIKLVVQALECDPPILNNALWKVRAELDIAQFEFSRNHWAIKDRDLLSVLRAAGYLLQATAVARFEERPLPAPTRSDLLDARKVIAKWSHTEIDDFLLEAGVRGLVARRDIGSSRDRANAIVEFAIEHPMATTAENSLFSAYIVRTISSTASSSELVADRSRAAAVSKTPQERGREESASRSPNRVFVVHGQNDSVRDAIVAFLSSVGLEGIVLHEQPSMGRHLLTKFIQEAELVTFAIVLMTDDDIGGLKGSDPSPRARQNVILELGYFLSHLGQQRVCALITPGLETPSDFDGIVYIRMGKDEQWKKELKRELRAVGMPLMEWPRSPEEMWPGKVICARCNGPIEGVESVVTPFGGRVHPFDCLDDG